MKTFLAALALVATFPLSVHASTADKLDKGMPGDPDKLFA
jgi:hypothetical protein